tara:strand:- start:15923 stop:16099 length:177 start_codon:yes stop_codon:yes gene_type:complete
MSSIRIETDNLFEDFTQNSQQENSKTDYIEIFLIIAFVVSLIRSLKQYLYKRQEKKVT